MMSARRGYWLSVAALVVALPVAVAVQGWGAFSDWRSQNERVPVPGEAGQPVDYAGVR